MDVLRTIIGALKEVLGKTPSSALLLEKYAKLCLVVDEVLNEVGGLHLPPPPSLPSCMPPSAGAMSTAGGEHMHAHTWVPPAHGSLS